MTENPGKKNLDSTKQTPARVEKPVAENSSPSVKAENKKSKEKIKKSRTAKEKQAFSKTALLALTVAVLVGVVVGYEYLILYKQGMFTAEFSNSQNKVISRISSLEQELKNTKNALGTENQARINAEAEFNAFKIAMEEVATKFGRTTNEWRIAEVEYLLTIANQRLNLTQDIRTAAAMLESADQRLQRIGDPALLEIRKSIKDELNALYAVQEPDLSGLAISLSSLASEVDRLPLIDKERVAVATGQIKDQAPENWKDIPAAIWKDIKSLVVVRRHQQPAEPLLPPAESWFLYQNLRLKLEQARLALLQRDTALLRQNLNEAETWLNTFFNEESPGVINALKTTAALSKVELQPAMPDVSGSLRQLRSLLVKRGVKIGN